LIQSAFEPALAEVAPGTDLDLPRKSGELFP
jgi:hypothetical protein